MKELKSVTVTTVEYKSCNTITHLEFLF